MAVGEGGSGYDGTACVASASAGVVGGGGAPARKASTSASNRDFPCDLPKTDLPCCGGTSNDDAPDEIAEAGAYTREAELADGHVADSGGHVVIS